MSETLGEWVVQQYGYVSLGYKDHRAGKARWRVWARTVHGSKDAAIEEVRGRLNEMFGEPSDRQRSFGAVNCTGEPFFKAAIAELDRIAREDVGITRLAVLDITYEIASINDATRADNRKVWLYEYDPKIEDCRDMDEYLPPVVGKPAERKRGWLW